MSRNEDKANEDMLPAERRQRVQNWFRDKVAASSQELARHFNTSISTIRRDLDYLAAQGVIRRTHGGAVRISPLWMKRANRRPRKNGPSPA